jgi:hypothetical protein
VTIAFAVPLIVPVTVTVAVPTPIAISRMIVQGTFLRCVMVMKVVLIDANLAFPRCSTAKILSCARMGHSPSSSVLIF